MPLTTRVPITHQHPLWKMENGAAPVRDLAQAVRYFTQVLGFTTSTETADAVLVVRDAAWVLLQQDPAHDPGTAGSCAWRTSDLNGMHEELTRTGAKPGAIEGREHEGRPLQVFFVREPDTGYCFCFSQPA